MRTRSEATKAAALGAEDQAVRNEKDDSVLVDGQASGRVHLRRTGAESSRGSGRASVRESRERLESLECQDIDSAVGCMVFREVSHFFNLIINRPI